MHYWNRPGPRFVLKPYRKKYVPFGEVAFYSKYLTRRRARLSMRVSPAPYEPRNR